MRKRGPLWLLWLLCSSFGIGDARATEVWTTEQVQRGISVVAWLMVGLQQKSRR